MREEFIALSGKVYIEDNTVSYKRVHVNNAWIKFAFAIPLIYFLISKSETIISHYNTDKLRFTIDIILLILSSFMLIIASVIYLVKFNWKRKIEVGNITEMHLIKEEDNIATIVKIFSGGNRYKAFIFRSLEGEHNRLKETLLKLNSTIKIVEETTR